MNRFRYGWLRLHLQLRFGRHDLCSDCPGGLAGGAVTRHEGWLCFRLVPRPMVDDQHAEYAESRDRNRDLQRRAATSIQAIIRQILRHPSIRVHFL